MAIIGTPIVASTNSVLSARTIAPAYSAAETYSVGDIVSYKGALYRCKEEIPVAEPWNSEHWTEITLVGELKTISAETHAETYIHVQNPASDVWTIHHNLNNYPAVGVVDSAGNIVVGDVRYEDRNTVVITFKAAFSGKAYLN